MGTDAVTVAAGTGMAVGLLAGGAITLLAIARFIWFVFELIAGYKVVEKMGEPGWKSFIPLYHDYILYKHVWSGGIGIAAICLECIAYGLMSVEQSPVIMLIGALFGVAVVVLNVIYAGKLSKAFGHGLGFQLGLIFFEPIFTMILGFSKDEFQG